ncbi:tRNA pseudouridine(38-40) synthase TruA [bacterium]|nr:MAG: tRNA pseudouridine(38-40) synthase TruA [bacterium]
MGRIKLVVAYDGTDFSGWELQHERRTVRGTLTEAVRLVSDEAVEIEGSSRTDAGAHAKGQVCHFDPAPGGNASRVPPERWPEILNRVLPPDLSVRSMRTVSDRFHSRFSVTSRHYLYRLHTGERDPHRSRFVHRHWDRLDVEAMREGARLLIGTHDFRAFTEELEPRVTNTVRHLFDVKVAQVRDEVRVDVIGTAFLRGMMRRMVGGLFEIGRGHRDVVEVSKLLDPQERENYDQPVVLPARGLCLMGIQYDRALRDVRERPLIPRPTSPASVPDFENIDHLENDQ